MDSNRGPLVWEATALPTEPQPLPMPHLFDYWIDLVVCQLLLQSLLTWVD